MPLNISENLPGQYLRAASSAADIVIDDDLARFHFAVVDRLRFGVVGCGDVDTVLVFVKVT